jgi:hypothetical protein
MVKLHENTKKHYCTICNKGYAGSSGLWYHNKKVHNAVTNSRPRNKISKEDSTEEQKKEVKTEKVEKVEKDVEDYNPEDDNPEDDNLEDDNPEDDDNEPNSIRKDSFNSDDPSFVFHRENPENSGLYVPLITEIDHIDDFSQEHNPDLYLNEKNLMNYLFPELNEEELEAIKNTHNIDSNHSEISSKEDILDEKKDDKKDDKSTSVIERKRRREEIDEIKQEPIINSNHSKIPVKEVISDCNKSERQIKLDRNHYKRKTRNYTNTPRY